MLTSDIHMARKLPVPITREEYELLLAREKKKEMRVVMMLMFEAGMRISEVVGLRNDIPALTQDRVENTRIRIIYGKGKKDRIVPRPIRFNKTACNMLPIKISRRSVQRRITNLGKKVLNKHITPHTLRHGFITHLIESGRPLHEVQMLAGHTKLETTGIYLHANPTKAIEGARDVFS